MKNILLRCILLFFLILAGSHCNHCFAQVADRTPDILKKQLDAEKQRGAKIEQEKKQLQELMKNREKKLENFDKQLQNYETNMQEAQKILEAAEKESSSIRKRNDERELVFYRCLFVLDSSNPLSAVKNPLQAFQYENMKEAGTQISRAIFDDILAENPRLDELEKLIQERQSYQQRILSVYLPADTQKKEIHEKLIKEDKKAIEEKDVVSKKIAENVKDLQKKLEEAQRRIEEIRRQHELAEKKRREEENKRQLAQSSKAKKKSKTQKAASVADDSLTGLKSGASWPVQGSVVRPFGDYVHPQYKVSMKNPGLDIQAAPKASVRAVSRASVMFNGNIPGMGRTVILNHGNSYLSVYGNVNSNVKENQSVEAQQVLGAVGDSAENGKNVIHFEIRKGETPINPLSWLKK